MNQTSILETKKKLPYEYCNSVIHCLSPFGSPGHRAHHKGGAGGEGGRAHGPGPTTGVEGGCHSEVSRMEGGDLALGSYIEFIRQFTSM